MSTIVKSTQLTDTVKIPVHRRIEVRNGLQFKGYKYIVVGYDYYLHTYDSPAKDYLISSIKLKYVSKLTNQKLK